MPKVRVVKRPGTDEAGAWWEVPDEVPEGVHLVEPSHVSFKNSDGTTTTYRIEEMPEQVIENETLDGFNRRLWKKNGGYPPGKVFVRGNRDEDLEVRMPEMSVPPDLQKRKRAAERLGNPAMRQLVDAEVGEHRVEWEAWLEERKRLGPGA